MDVGAVYFLDSIHEDGTPWSFHTRELRTLLYDVQDTEARRRPRLQTPDAARGKAVRVGSPFTVMRTGLRSTDQRRRPDEIIRSIYEAYLPMLSRGYHRGGSSIT